MSEVKCHVWLEDEEYKQLIESVIELRNNLIKQGKFTDDVDDVLYKLINTKKKRMKIRYV